MGLDIDENFEVVNYDNARLKELRKFNNTLDDGALCILDALDDFCEVQLDKYDGSIPYDKLFCALHQIIKSANENENVRNALMTGLISEKKKNSMLQQKVIKATPVTKKVVTKKSYNKSAIALFAKTHTASEVYKHFNFPNRSAAKRYLDYHKINYISEEKVSDKNEDYIRQLTELGKYMGLCEIARTLGKTKHAVCMFCMRHEINYVGKGERKNVNL